MSSELNGPDWAPAEEEMRMGAYWTVVEMQRPCVIFRPKLSIDGNQWCALYGDDLQSGVAGFGDSPEKAMADFDANWRRSISKRSRGSVMVEHPFTDPASGERCVVHFGEAPGVEHPDCEYRAEVQPELDAFFCRGCGRSGRLPVAWFMDLLATTLHAGDPTALEAASAAILVAIGDDSDEERINANNYAAEALAAVGVDPDAPLSLLRFHSDAADDRRGV